MFAPVQDRIQSHLSRSAHGTSFASLSAGLIPGRERSSTSNLQSAPARAAYDVLANGAPLAALQAHLSLLFAGRRHADVRSLRSLVASGDRLARGLAIRPLARFAESDFDATLFAFVRSDDQLLREQSMWALADRPATPAGIDVAVGAIAEGGFAATIAQLTIERWATTNPSLMSAIPAALEDHAEIGARVRLIETASIADRDDIHTLLVRLLRSTGESTAVRAAAARGLAAQPTSTLLGRSLAVRQRRRA